MNAFTRREDLGETDRAQKKLDNPSSNLIPEEDGFDKQRQSEDPVQADVIVQDTCETFMNGAGI